MKKIIILVTVVAFITGCNNNSGWSSADRKKMIADCIKAARGTTIEDRAKSYCECMQPIMEAKYPTVAEANKITPENMQTPEMRKEAQKCLGIENSDDNNNNGNINNTGNDNETNNWSNQQRRQFVQDCAGTAQEKQGFTPEEANNYCDCMQRKMEKKFNYSEVSRLTAADLQTEEWRQAMIDCGARQ